VGLERSPVRETVIASKRLLRVSERGCRILLLHRAQPSFRLLLEVVEVGTWRET
jgi:hypothetical protein